MTQETTVKNLEAQIAVHQDLELPEAAYEAADALGLEEGTDFRTFDELVSRLSLAANSRHLGRLPEVQYFVVAFKQLRRMKRDLHELRKQLLKAPNSLQPSLNTWLSHDSAHRSVSLRSWAEQNSGDEALSKRRRRS